MTGVQTCALPIYKGAVIGIDRFGASAPGKIALDKLGINVAHVVETAKGLVKHFVPSSTR